MTNFVAIIENHDRTARRAVLPPVGATKDFDKDYATREWLWPYLGTRWHLVEFLDVHIIREDQRSTPPLPASNTTDSNDDGP